MQISLSREIGQSQFSNTRILLFIARSIFARDEIEWWNIATNKCILAVIVLKFYVQKNVTAIYTHVMYTTFQLQSGCGLIPPFVSVY